MKSATDLQYIVIGLHFGLVFEDFLCHEGVVFGRKLRFKSVRSILATAALGECRYQTSASIVAFVRPRRFYRRRQKLQT